MCLDFLDFHGVDFFGVGVQNGVDPSVFIKKAVANLPSLEVSPISKGTGL